MRFLRLLTNSLIAGALGAAYLTIVVLQLNPHVPLWSATTARLFGALELFYGIHLAVLFYLLIVAREVVGFGVSSPGWVSVRVLAWLAAAASIVASLLMWLNVRGFAVALDETTVRRMTAGAAALSATSIVLLGLAIAHYSFGRRGSRVGAALLAIAIFGSIALPVAARGPGRPMSAAPQPSTTESTFDQLPDSSPSARVVMLLLDGASLEYVWPRIAGGRLPNFARLLESGASMDLATIRPTSPDPVWTAVATGMYPARNGVQSPARYYLGGDDRALALLPDHCFSHVLVHLGLLRREQSSSSALRSRPLWQILGDAGISVGVVRWPLTYPARPVPGFILTDRFHDQIGSLLELDEGAAYPLSVLPIVRQSFLEQTEHPEWLPAADAASVPAEMPEVAAGIRDGFYSRAMQDLEAQGPKVRFSALRYTGLDTVGHYNLRYTRPNQLGDPAEDERRRRLQFVDKYYGYIDAEIGRALGSLTAGDLLLVISGFGMEQPNMLKQLLSRVLGDGISGTHERAPDGFLLAYGTLVEPGRRPRGSILDVTPTVLYFLGLPVGRDMDGYARADLFRASFAAGRPVAFIPTHNR